MKRIAFFDFDGTITRRDSFVEFIKYCKGVFPMIVGFFINSPWLLGYKLKLISNEKAKERLLTYFFSGHRFNDFQKYCDCFSVEIVPTLLIPEALSEIKKLQGCGVSIVIVTASPENWLKKWAGENGIDLIATRLKVSDNTITGKILGSNCHGKEKVARIKMKYDLTEYEEIFAYGNSKSDLYMLELAQHAFYRKFNQ